MPSRPDRSLANPCQPCDGDRHASSYVHACYAHRSRTAHPGFRHHTRTGTSGGTTAACAPVKNETFVTELLTLINNARTSNGLTALTVNPKLSAAANAHATDMLCNNYLSPIGLDGSTAQTRVAKQGYSTSIVVENLYALHPAFGMSPQAAFNWWNRNTPSP